jgi:hypothetical protein
MPDDRERIGLKNPYCEKQPSRIWPAFGKDGGACEIAMTEDVLRSTRPPVEVPSGGGEEPYFLDSVHAGEINLAAVDLATTIRDWFNYEKKPEELALDDPNEKPVIKVVPPNGATLSWKGWRTKKRYSISCAYDLAKSQSGTELLFWGDVWQDENTKRKICSLENLSRRWCHELPVNQLKGRPDIYRIPIQEHLRAILTELKNLAERFPDPRPVNLLPYMGLSGRT